MERSRNYSVAGHVFTLTAPEHVWTLLANYAPFVTEQDTTLFHLVVALQEQPDQEQLEHVYTDSSDDDMPRIEVYRRSNNGWAFFVSMYKNSDVVTRLLTNADFSAATVYVNTNDVRFAIDNAAMLLFAFTSAPHYTLELHASVIKKDNFGYLFLGKSGTGKSTHSRQWLEAFDTAELLNDDNPIVRLEGVGTKHVEPKVYGSPWSGKTLCYHNDCAPIKAIVKLSQAPQNEIHPLRLPEAYAYLLGSSSGLKIVPKMMDALYNTISTLIQSVQVYGLACLPNPEAAKVCFYGTQSSQ